MSRSRCKAVDSGGRSGRDMQAMRAEAEKVIALYQRHAQAFDRLRRRSLFEKSWLDRFLAALPARRSVLDLGCGSGEPIAHYLIESGCTITGVDTSPGLLEMCRSRFPYHTWIEGDMRRLSLDGCFDGLIAWDSFFLLTPVDQRRMFGTFRGRIGRGAALMFTSGPEATERSGCFEGEPLYCASLAEQEYRALLDQHGFDVLCHIAEDPDCDCHTVWLARAR